jgi:hypothetical protein
MEKYLDFMTVTSTALRQEMASAPTQEARYKAMEKLERLVKLQPKITKLQAAINLDQKSVIKRLQNQLDLEMEVLRLEMQ